MNPPVSVTISPPVVSVTLRAPKAAKASIVMDAVAEVVLFTVSELTVTPPPNVAVVVPCTQCVKFPAKATLAMVWPCVPLLGVTLVRTGVPALTVNPLASEAVSFGVLTVTVRVPVAAAGSIEILTLSEVGLVTVMVPGVMPAPKLTVLEPCAKWVLVPVMTTESAWPCCPLFGATLEIAARPAFTVNALAAVRTLEPVVVVTARKPSAASGSMLTLTVKELALVNVVELMVTPAPILTVVAAVQPEFTPRIVTFKVWPWTPLFAFTLEIAGLAATVKMPVPTAVSVPLVTVTLRAPRVAAEEMETLAVAEVSELATIEFTVTPAPNVAASVPVPFSHVVPLPVRTTLRLAWPKLPVLGFAETTVGAARMVKPLVSVRASEPVVTWTLVAPSVAPGAMVMLAVRLVGLETLTLFTVMPGPKFAALIPW